jgi:protein-S-isoprenylcysteine O-methyltransferase Ste14
MPAEIRWTIFGVVSVLLAWVSRRSLLSARTHGFYRFFAWEMIVLLVLLNASAWFRDWLSLHQLISWAFLLVSLVPLILGLRALRARGMPDQSQRPDSTLLGFERTTQLVSGGIYRFIRHPLYCSLLLLAWGVFFKAPSTVAFLLAAAATGLLLMTARMDERECLQVFGSEYGEYMRRTRMFIPFVV